MLGASKLSLVAAAERIRLRVAAREGVKPAKVLDAIRDYASQETRNPWLVKSRRPLVLTHRSPRAEGVRYSFERDGDEITLVIAGSRARLGLAYAMTMLASARFADAVSSVEVRLPETAAARR
jgi:hypothetical protein